MTMLDNVAWNAMSAGSISVSSIINMISYRGSIVSMHNQENKKYESSLMSDCLGKGALTKQGLVAAHGHKAALEVACMRWAIVNVLMASRAIMLLLGRGP